MLPEATTVLERGFGAATQFYAFPEAHWTRLRTTNGLERPHAEIKRRIRAVGAFPEGASPLRLITAVALRVTETWGSRRYLGVPLLARGRRSTKRPDQDAKERPLTVLHIIRDLTTPTLPASPPPPHLFIVTSDPWGPRVSFRADPPPPTV